MRVLHVIPSVSPRRGGPSFAIRTMCEGLAQHGIAVDLVTTDDDGDQRYDIPAVQPVELDSYNIWYFKYRSFYHLSIPLTRWLEQNISNYDIVHIHSLWSYPALPAAYFARQKEVPYIVRPLGAFSRWGMENRRPTAKRLSFQLLEGRVVRNAAFIHYTAEQERIEARDLGIDTASKVVPLGIDLSPFEHLPSAGLILQEYPSLEGRTVILFLSRIDRKKGLDLLLPVFARVSAQHPKAVLLIVGDGDPNFMQQLNEETEELGISNNVIWAGFRTGEEKLAAFASADIFVLPSYTENFGIVVVEAMASRIPVIVSDQVAIAPEIIEADAGLVIQLNPDALESALTELILDPEQRQLMGINGHELASETFSHEAMIGNLMQMYRDTIGGPRVKEI